MQIICNIKFKFLCLNLVWYTTVDSAVQSHYQPNKNVVKLKAETAAYNTNYFSRQLVGTVNIFRYTGSIQSVSIPAEVTSISVHLWYDKIIS